MCAPNLREFACELTSSWPPARVEVGSEQQFTTSLPVDCLDPVDPVDPLDCSKLVFYLSETLLSPYLAAPGGQIGFSYVSPQSTCSKWRDTRVEYHTRARRHFEQVDCLQKTHKNTYLRIVVA